MLRWHQVFSKRVSFVFKFCIGNWKKKIFLDTKNVSFGCPVTLCPSLLPSILILVYSVTAVSDVFLPPCLLKPCLCNYCNCFIGENCLSVFSYKRRKLMEGDFQLHLHVWVCVKTEHNHRFFLKIDKLRGKCYLWKKLKTVTGVNYRKHVLTCICFFL